MIDALRTFFAKLGNTGCGCSPACRCGNDCRCKPGKSCGAGCACAK